MANSLFGIGVNALQTSQRALNTVSHNIANVNNPAFSRQRNDITARESQFIAGGFKGTGAQLSDIRRAVDQFLVADIRNGTASREEKIEYYSFKVESTHDRIEIINYIADRTAELAEESDKAYLSEKDRHVGSQRIGQLEKRLSEFEDKLSELKTASGP